MRDNLLEITHNPLGPLDTSPRIRREPSMMGVTIAELFVAIKRLEGKVDRITDILEERNTFQIPMNFES